MIGVHVIWKKFYPNLIVDGKINENWPWLGRYPGIWSHFKHDWNGRFTDIDKIIDTDEDESPRERPP